MKSTSEKLKLMDFFCKMKVSLKMGLTTRKILGMNGIKMKIVNKRATDPFDRLIFEQGLRAQQVLIADKKLDSLVVLLNNGMILRVAISTYSKLKDADQLQLNQWELIAGGIGIRWDALDEDLSIKGLIKESALNEALNQLQNNYKSKISII